MTETMDPRTWADEDLHEILRLADRLGARENLGKLAELVEEVEAEIARRAEIKISRWADVKYGPNRYGFTWDGIGEFHDASWYESRQTEAEFLAEMGAGR